MLKKIGLAFGVIFVLVGLAGYVPALTPDGKLLGMFAVNGPHNLVHLATGVIALAIALGSPANLSLFFKVFGVVYALVAVLGFFSGDQPLLGLIAHNTADLWLHVVIAAVSLWIGFGMKDAGVTAA
ncbi:MAG TPA: DUF4383 domain-containing protein [Casimicrobiaceae bacterium]|jgi:hypothetical protein|nr:DUF4383 domain-containing protein [Casimicrobiaceae bacterium]